MTNGWRFQAVVVGALLIVGVVLASAQVRWGSPAVPRAGACFYENADMRGRSFCARPGEDLSTLPGDMRDTISSIRVFGGAEVVVFSDARFRGRSARFGTDVTDLRRQGWNDQISSIRVTARSGWNGSRPPAWGDEPVPREGACFYKDAGFRGPHFCLPRGASYAMVPAGFNDQISSIRVRRAVVMIFVDAGFGGRSTRVDSDVDDLRRSWNDAISSIRVF